MVHFSSKHWVFFFFPTKKKGGDSTHTSLSDFCEEWMESILQESIVTISIK